MKALDKEIIDTIRDILCEQRSGFTTEARIANLEALIISQKRQAKLEAIPEFIQLAKENLEVNASQSKPRKGRYTPPVIEGFLDLEAQARLVFGEPIHVRASKTKHGSEGARK